MNLDRTLVKEIKACNGDGSREAKFTFLKKLDAVNKDLSTVDIADTFTDCLKKHGRAAVAICVAATLFERRERLDNWNLAWALAVLELWTNRPYSYLSRGNIDDGLHPTRICQYAGSFINLTMEE